MSTIIECGARREYAKNIIDAASAISDASALKNARLLITGATGLVGGAFVRTLLYLNRTQELNISLLLPVRSLERAKTALYGIYGRSEVSVFEADIEVPLNIEGKIDYMLHAASPTASKEFTSHPASVLTSVLKSNEALLDLARLKSVKKYLYISSMEAFGVTASSDTPAREEDLGYVSLSSPRSCYPEGKRVNELMCLCYAGEYGVNALSARLAQTFGAGIGPNENRVFAQFARSALKGENLVLRTKGESVGNYVHISDCVSALITLLLKGESGETYTVVGDNCSAKIKELAYLISSTLSGGKSRVVFDLPKDSGELSYAPDTCLRLDNSKLKTLGWTPVHSLADAIKSLGEDIKQFNGEEKA